MVTARSAVLLATTGLFLAACASTPRTETVPLAASSADTVDQAYVDAVNRAASKAGVKVVWLHPPREADRDE